MVSTIFKPFKELKYNRNVVYFKLQMDETLFYANMTL